MAKIKQVLLAQGVHHDIVALSKDQEFMKLLDSQWQGLIKRMAKRAEYNISQSDEALRELGDCNHG